MIVGITKAKKMKKSGRQKKSKRRRNKVDRISNLPDSLIQHILSFLPSTRSAIRTGILSKRWRNQWRQVPVLTFHDEGFKHIENVLNQNECSKLEQFHISPSYDESLIGTPELGSKIGLAISRNVKELTVDVHNVAGFHRMRLPESLFSYSLLVKLKTTNCILNPTKKVNWKHLKEFSAYRSKFPGRAVEHILSGCPLLESLNLNNNCRIFHFAIVSKSLRKLSVEGYLVSEIRISCPNLEELRLIEVPGLACPSIEFFKEHLSGLDIKTENLQSLISATLNFGITSQFKDTLMQLQHVKELKIGGKFIKSLSRLEGKEGARVEIMHVFGVLWSNLKTVQIDGLSERDTKLNDVLNFIEILLENAEMLSKLIVTINSSGKSFVNEVSRKISSTPRCSQHLKVRLLWRWRGRTKKVNIRDAVI